MYETMNEVMSKSSQVNQPWRELWPKEDLESVGHCPVCGEASRAQLHSDLIDSTFAVAQGKWDLWRCVGCRSAYLDPRPSKETIGRAYASYYTHEESCGKEEYSSLGTFRRIRRRLVNGYTNWRYRTTAFPANALGVLLAGAVPSFKCVLDREYRHLPRHADGSRSLLDVGCGNGAFLALANTCGWNATGVDPDPLAVASARKRGMHVFEGGIDYFGCQTELFDVITLNHVIEHAHNPTEVLTRCRALLKPGGQLWVETPNLDSFGYAYFRQHWRGLETPRHLVLFNRESLFQALTAAGFVAPEDRSRPSACAGMFEASFALACGLPPNTLVQVPRAVKIRAGLARVAEMLIRSRREFLTISAKRI